MTLLASCQRLLYTVTISPSAMKRLFDLSETQSVTFLTHRLTHLIERHAHLIECLARVRIAPRRVAQREEAVVYKGHEERRLACSKLILSFRFISVDELSHTNRRE